MKRDTEIPFLLSLQLFYLIKPVSFRKWMNVTHACSSVILYERL